MLTISSDIFSESGVEFQISDFIDSIKRIDPYFWIIIICLLFSVFLISQNKKMLSDCNEHYQEILKDCVIIESTANENKTFFDTPIMTKNPAFNITIPQKNKGTYIN